MVFQDLRKSLLTVLFVTALGYGSFYVGHSVVRSPNMWLAVVAGFVAAAACVWIILRGGEDHQFLLKLFIAALVARWVVGYFIFSNGLQSFFGGDAISYDAFGNALCQSWQGAVDPDSPWLTRYTDLNRPGWGMYYYVALIYYVIGPNPLAVQFINCALGASACVAAYKIAALVYPSQRVARTAAVLTAFSPSLILWSSQILKDGLIVLFLCLCTLFTLKLRHEFKTKSLVLLLVSLLCVFVLRNYAGYIIFISIAGTFLLTAKTFSPVRMLQGAMLVLVLGMTLAYIGGGDVTDTASHTLDLKRIQSAREWSAKVSESGYGGDVDITDPEAALAFLPVGVLYVLLAPFPWMINNLRQFITLPELLIWWALVPIMLKGYWFAIRHRMRETFAITFFTVTLTLAYALYQSNAGTAFRHRAQLYVFFSIFISIGMELRRAAKFERLRGFGRNRPPVAPYAPAAVQATGSQTSRPAKAF